MAKQKQNRFSGRTSRSMEKPKFNYGYLKLPDDVDIFRPEGGTEVIFDILPYIVTDGKHTDNKKYPEDAVMGEMWWKRPIRVHRQVGQERKSVVCPTTFGDKCPICEYGNRLRREGADYEDVREIFPQNRSLFYVFLLDAGESEKDYAEGELHIMDISDNTFLQYIDEEVKRNLNYEGFPDPEDGLSLKCYFRNKKFKKTTYPELSKVEFIERDSQYEMDYIEGLPSLDKIIEVFDYNTLKAMYSGMDDLDDGDTDSTPFAEQEEDDAPKRKPKSPRTRKTFTREEPVEEEDEEEEEEPKPKRSRSKKPADTEPEEEPKPKPKPKRKKPAMECPHDLIFGQDFDQYEVCDTCEVWQDCRDENKKMNSNE